jgi:transcriptional regulator with XRE-family HTH domain
MDTHPITDTVRRLMTSRGLTGTAVAARAGLHTQTMHTWLRGERTGGGPTVGVLAAVLAVIDEARPLSGPERAAVLAALGVATPDTKGAAGG